MRADNIDILKAICAFLIVCIHAPFPGIIGEYFTALTRIAVPVFFMITGYFYLDVEKKNGEIRQIKKIYKKIPHMPLFCWTFVGLYIISFYNYFALWEAGHVQATETEIFFYG